MKIILTGVTGYVGEGVLLELLKMDEVEKVLSVSRKTAGIKHEKLEEYLVPDFMRLQDGDPHFKGYDAVFFIAGISSVGAQKEVYVRISQETPLHFADIMPDKDKMTFIYLSGAGTDANGHQFWQKVKRRTELELQEKGFKRSFAFRPAMMTWAKGQKRIQAFQYLFIPFYPIFRLIGLYNKMREVAQAMVTCSRDGYEKSVLTPFDIEIIGKESLRIKGEHTKRTMSFINENDLVPIKYKAVLLSMMSQCEKDNNLILENLDLSEMIDCNSICFDNYTLNNIVFSKFSPDNPKKRHLFKLSFVGAKLNKVSFAQAHLQQCNFDTKDVIANKLQTEKMHVEDTQEDKDDEKTSELNEVDFFFSELEYCRFRRTQAKHVDFRYSHVRDCTMSEFDVTFGDFYFCNFEGSTNFIDSRFKDCSLTCTSFENDCIRMNSIKGLAQESSEAYYQELIHNPIWLKYNPCHSFSSMNHKANKGKNIESDAKRAGEAMNVYKQLSGLYAGKGLNRDSNRAYRKSKLCEIEHCKLKMKLALKNREFKMFLGYLFSYSDAWLRRLFGFGYQWTATIFWFLFIVAVFGCYGMWRESKKDDYEIMFNSLYNSMGPYEEFTYAVPLPWASIESFMGILLIGFLGFIFANNIRNDS